MVGRNESIYIYIHDKNGRYIAGVELDPKKYGVSFDKVKKDPKGVVERLTNTIVKESLLEKIVSLYDKLPEEKIPERHSEFYKDRAREYSTGSDYKVDFQVQELLKKYGIRWLRIEKPELPDKVQLYIHFVQRGKDIKDIKEYPEFKKGYIKVLLEKVGYVPKGIEIPK